MIKSGRIIELILLLTIIAVFLYLLNRARSGQSIPKLRRIPAIDAMDEAVGRVVEMGQGIHFGTGAGSTLSGVNAPMTLAGISVASYIARLCARLDAPFIYTTNLPDMVPLMEDVIQTAYNAEGMGEKFEPEAQVRYIANDQTVYGLHVGGVMEREKTGANIYLGPTRGETPIVLERAKNIGAMCITGTGRWVLIPIHAVMADYFLIMEELFVAGAYLSEDKEMISTVASQDFPKAISLLLIILGILAALVNSDIIIQLLQL